MDGRGSQIMATDEMHNEPRLKADEARINGGLRMDQEASTSRGSAPGIQFATSRQRHIHPPQAITHPSLLSVFHQSFSRGSLYSSSPVTYSVPLHPWKFPPGQRKPGELSDLLAPLGPPARRPGRPEGNRPARRSGSAGPKPRPAADAAPVPRAGSRQTPSR